MSPRMSILVSFGMLLLLLPGVAHRVVVHNTTSLEVSVSSSGKIDAVEEVHVHRQKKRELVIGTLLIKFGASVVFGLGKFAVKKFITEPRDWQREMQWYEALLERACFGRIVTTSTEAEEVFDRLNWLVASKTQEEFTTMKASMSISATTVTEVLNDTAEREEVFLEASKDVGSGFASVQKLSVPEDKHKDPDEDSHVGEVVAIPLETIAHMSVEHQIQEYLVHIVHLWQDIPEGLAGAAARAVVGETADMISWATLPIGMLIQLFNTNWGTSASSKERFAFAVGSVIGGLIAGLDFDERHCPLVMIYKELEDRLICWSHTNARETMPDSWMQRMHHAEGDDVPNVPVNEKVEFPGTSDAFIKEYRDKVSNFASECPAKYMTYLKMASKESRGLCDVPDNRAVSCDPLSPYVQQQERRVHMCSSMKEGKQACINGAGAKNFISNNGYVCLDREGCDWWTCTVGDHRSSKCSVMAPLHTCGDLNGYTWDWCGNPCSEVRETTQVEMSQMLGEICDVPQM